MAEVFNSFFNYIVGFIICAVGIVSGCIIGSKLRINKDNKNSQDNQDI